MTSNVSATSTTGLYGISGNVSVPNSAQQLLNLLYSNGNVDFSLTGAGNQVQANALIAGGGGSSSVQLTGNVTGTGITGSPINTIITPTGVVPGTYGSDNTIPTIVVGSDGRVLTITTNTVSGGGSYGNSNVAAYLPTDATIIALQSNAATQQTQINTNTSGLAILNANVGAFETYANVTFSTVANAATQAGQIAVLDANLGTATTNITTLFANAASQQTQINTNTSGLATLNANVGAYETWANVTFATQANLTAFETYANATFATGGGSSYGNSNVAAFLPVYGGNISLGNITNDGHYWQFNADGSETFSSATAVTTAAGKFWYNGTDGSWNAGMGGGNITQQIGEELFRYGKASSAITDSPLQLVYKTGVVGASGVITFAPTVAGITDGDQILGCATEPIALNAFGRITTYGIIHNITTNGTAYGETWADNDDIYYNPVTGGLTKTLPSAPGLKLLVGTVINAASGGAGSFSVKLGVATYLSKLSDVQLSSNTGGQVLTYNQSAGYWKNTSLVAGTNIAITPYTNGNITIDGTYGNTQVAAYLPTYTGSLDNSSSIIALQSNAASQQTQINTNTSGLATLNANVGAFETYANVTFGTSNYGNANVAGFLTANTTTVAIGSIGGIVTATGNNGAQFVVGAAGGGTTGASAYLTTGTGLQLAQNTNLNLVNGGNITLAGGAVNTGYITVANGVIANSVTSTTGFFWANGVAYSTGSGSAYGNTQVAAFLNGTAPTINSGLGNVLIISGDGAQMVLSNAVPGNYSGYTAAFNSTNVYVSSGNITSRAVGTAGGYIASTFGPTLSTGLYDTVNGRVFANAYPLSTPSTSVVGNYFSNYIIPAPVYTSGVLQPPATPSGQVNSSGTTVTLATTANIAQQSSYQSTNNRNVNSTVLYTQLWPTSANSMTSFDRVRGVSSILDVNMGGKTWNGGAMGTQVVSSAGILNMIGSGNIVAGVGQVGSILVTPSGATANVQYGTGFFGAISLSSSNTGAVGNVQYARLLAGSVTGFSSNLTVAQAIGVHTPSGWAGTVGTLSSGAQQAYTILNEDASTKIQTNGNLVVTGNTQIKALQETVYATGFTGGAWTANAAQGTIQTATLTSSITSLAFTNLPAGGTVTLIITQGGSGSYTLTTTGILYAGGSKTLSTAVGAIDMLNIMFDGTNYYGSLVKGYA